MLLRLEQSVGHGRQVLSGVEDQEGGGDGGTSEIHEWAGRRGMGDDDRDGGRGGLLLEEWRASSPVENVDGRNSYYGTAGSCRVAGSHTRANARGQRGDEWSAKSDFGAASWRNAEKASRLEFRQMADRRNVASIVGPLRTLWEKLL